MSELHFDVVGAAGPKTYFERLAPSSLAHAYLFNGPSGAGKKTFARRLAQSLLCTAPKSGLLGYDDSCASCRLFRQGAHHPDFLEHEGILKIGDRDAGGGFASLEELSARDLVRQLSMQSYGGGKRVLLLGDVDFATPHAANALLKFLEEPPAGVVMLLTTSAPGRLLDTIRSRTIELRFTPLSKAELREVLAHLHYGDQDADLGASLGNGSVKRAIAALAGEEESLRALVTRWFFDCVAGVSPEETWASRDTLDEGLHTVKTLVRDWVAAGAASQAAPVALDYAEKIRALGRLDPARAVAMLASMDDAQRLARTNVSPAMVSELVRMAITSAG